MTMQRILKGAGVAGLAVAMASTAALAGGKIEFKNFGQVGFVPMSMTADGSKIVGTAYFGAPGFYYTEAEGLVTIGGGCGAGTFSISGDGSTIAGCTMDENDKQVAAKWLGGEDWLSLGSVPGAVSCDASLSSSWGVDYYGHTAVGLAWLAQQCRAHAGSWDLVGGGPATDLGSLVDNRATRANGISGDGHVIIGWQDDEFGQRQGAKWIDGVESPVLTASGENVGEVQWINFDGTAMCGSSYPYGSSDAWVWNAKGGYTTISTGPIYKNNVVAIAASDDGSMVIGIGRDPQGTPKGWLFSKGKLTWMSDYLAKKHMAAGWTGTIPTAISADGNTLAGQGINPDGQVEGWVIKNFK
jgi:uncharacterized membrane protein